MRALGNGGFEYVGLGPAYVHPTVRHAERMRVIRRCFERAERNSHRSLQAQSRYQSLMSIGNWADSDRWHKRHNRYYRLFLKRIAQHRELSERLSRALFERGL